MKEHERDACQVAVPEQRVVVGRDVRRRTSRRRRLPLAASRSARGNSRSLPARRSMRRRAGLCDPRWRIHSEYLLGRVSDGCYIRRGPRGSCRYAPGMPDDKIRLGGMALSNGVLVHGPTSWACAIRTDDGELKVAAERKRLIGSSVSNPLLRGPARLVEAFAFLPRLKRLPEAKLPFERPRVLASMAGSAVVLHGVRRSRLGDTAKELLGGSCPVAPRCSPSVGAARRLPRRRAHRDRELRARRAARQGARALRLAPRRPAARDDGRRQRPRRARSRAPRCASGLLPGSRRPSARSPPRPSSSAGCSGTRAPACAGAGEARPRAPAPARDGRAVARAARGRGGSAPGVPRARSRLRQPP